MVTNGKKYRAQSKVYIPLHGPILVAARSKAWVCGRSLARTAGSTPARRKDVCLLSVVFCQVVVCASG